MAAYVAYFGSTSFAEFEEMDHHETLRFVRHLGVLHQQQIELQVTLAKFAAGARLGSAGAAEVR